MRYIRIAAVFFVVLAFGGVSTTGVKAAPVRQNIVLILTDDQRWDSLAYMPQVESLLAAHGITFASVFDNNPLCCPTRTTIMTGLTSGHNGVWWNQNGPFGGYKGFLQNHDQERQIFGWLHDAGYRTAMIGKYLNGYGFSSLNWVMPGVDDWQAFLLESQLTCRTNGYRSTCYSNNGTLEQPDPGDYSTVTSGQKAVDFIRSVPTGQPLLLYYAPRAPHVPTIPEASYELSCQQVPRIRPPSYNKTIVNGPHYMTSLKWLARDQRAGFDLNWIRSCQTLLSVDDQVAAIVQALSETGRLSNTLIAFASDNGLMFGEHRWVTKKVPYEESIRIPLVIRDDAVIPPNLRGTTLTQKITSLDFTPTFLQAAGLSRSLDGQSLFPLLAGDARWVPQSSILIEHWGKGALEPPGFCGIRGSGYMYARYETAEEELYDLQSDPYELTNVVGDPRYAGILNQLRVQTRLLCDPAPPGYSWSSPDR